MNITRENFSKIITEYARPLSNPASVAMLTAKRYWATREQVTQSVADSSDIPGWQPSKALPTGNGVIYFDGITPAISDIQGTVPHALWPINFIGEKTRPNLSPQAFAWLKDGDSGYLCTALASTQAVAHSSDLGGGTPYFFPYLSFGIEAAGADEGVGIFPEGFDDSHTNFLIFIAVLFSEGRYDAI